MEYPLCDRTVTIYRLENGQVTRRVAQGCFFRRERRIVQDGQGLRRERSFLLIQPGENPIYPGDRIFPGEGPAVSVAQWQAFTPEQVDELEVVCRARAYHFRGKTCHYEAE